MPNVQRISFVLYAFHTFYIVQQIPMPTVEYDLFLCLLYTCSRFSNLLYCTLDLHAHCAMYFQAYCTSVQAGGLLSSLFSGYYRIFAQKRICINIIIEGRRLILVMEWHRSRGSGESLLNVVQHYYTSLVTIYRTTFRFSAKDILWCTGVSVGRRQGPGLAPSHGTFLRNQGLKSILCPSLKNTKSVRGRCNDDIQKRLE